METYKAVCEALQILENDGEWEFALSEAAITQASSQIRDLFNTILQFCEPANPRMLFDKHHAEWLDDYKWKFKEATDDEVVAMLLLDLESKFELREKGLNDYNLPPVSENLRKRVAELRSEKELERQPMAIQEQLDFELEVISERLRLRKVTLNERQLQIFRKVTEAIDQEEMITRKDSISVWTTENQTSEPTKVMKTCFFIDARGGTGKTFLLNTILDYARSLNGEKRIAIAVASSGIAATLLSLGKTFHSCFKVPIQHGRVDPFITFNIAKDSVHAKIIREATLIVWDEAPMSHRYLLEGLDRTLRDVMNSKEPFGGKIVLLAGDFRQVLPVIRRGSRAQTTRAAINRSPLWQFFDMNTLVENVRIGKDPARSEFRELLQKVGEGKVPKEVDPDYIRIPEEFLFEIDDRCESTINDSLDKFIDLVFPNLKDRLSGDPEEFSAWIAERAILTPRNDAADCINDRFLRRYPGSEVECCSADSTMMEDDAVGFSVEFLNEQNPSGMPPHCLNLKAGFVLILLRNLNPKKGLCNGTRLIVVHASNVLLECTIAGGDFAGEMVLIPRLNLIANEGELPMRWRRRQFPVKVAFAMTINKAQGQTLRTVGIWLRDPVFSHGQFYVGISRVGDPKELHVAICRSDGGLTRNVVYAEALSSYDDTNGSKVYISRTEQRNPVKRRLDMNPPDDDVPALKSVFIQDEDVMTVEPFEDESDQIMSTVLHSRNVCDLTCAELSELWNEDLEQLQIRLQLFRDSNKAQEPQNRFFSCGPDAFLDMLFFGVLPHLTEDFIPSKCTTAINSEIESCDCAFCSTLSNFTKKIIRYYYARKCIVDRNQLLSLNNGMWDEMVNLQPASFQPKGTVNAAIQTLPSLLQNEEILATSQISPTFGVTRVARCHQCSTRSPLQYLPSLELYVQNRASLKTLILESMSETPYRCEACDSGQEICEITFGDFLIINLAHSTDENFRTDPNFLVGFFKIDDTSYRLRGMIKNTGGHYIAIVEHLNRCLLLDDLREWPVCGTSFDYCLTALDDRKRVYLNDTCLIVYQKC